MILLSATLLLRLICISLFKCCVFAPGYGHESLESGMLGVRRIGEMILTGEKPCPVRLPRGPPQISRGLTQDTTRASTVRGRRLIA